MSKIAHALRIITDKHTYEKVDIQVVDSTKAFIMNDLLGSEAMQISVHNTFGSK